MTAARVQTPDWLLQPEAGLCPCGCIGKRRKGSFVAKTIAGAGGVLQAALFSEDVARTPGLLQRLDARAKVLALVGLLIAVGLVHHVSVLVVAYAGTIVLAAASRLPIGFFVKRVWLFIPIFTGVIVLPATLNVITPGEIVVPLPFGLGLTRQGLMAAAILTIRVATSISLVLLVTLTTPWARLLSALRALGVPRLFVLVIGMAYRYLFVLLTAVQDMYVARRSRAIAPERDPRGGRAFVGATAGALFGKANVLADEVHQAMTSRGYRGDARTLDRFRITALDIAVLATAAAGMLLLIGGDRAIG
jgi:cobalt/nickel transport system permease protein